MIKKTYRVPRARGKGRRKRAIGTLDRRHSPSGTGLAFGKPACTRTRAVTQILPQILLPQISLPWMEIGLTVVLVVMLRMS
jgi:hypothetical protein